MQIAHWLVFVAEVGVLALLVAMLVALWAFVRASCLTRKLGWEKPHSKTRLVCTLFICVWLMSSAVYGSAATLVRLYHVFF